MSWQTELEKDLDWRLAELAALKLQAAGARSGSILQNALLRALVAMLYAHYEGFCKIAIRIYLREVRATGIKRVDCKERLVTFSLQKTFREAKSFTTDQCWEFYNESLDQMLQGGLEYELDKNGEIALLGESNMYPTDLKANLEYACLPQTEVDNHKQLLKGLVGRRNGIAHGEKMLVKDLSAYEELEKAATSAMYDITYSIIETLENQAYCKPMPYYG